MAQVCLPIGQVSTNLAGLSTKAGGVAFTTLSKLLQIPHTPSRQSRCSASLCSTWPEGSWCVPTSCLGPLTRRMGLPTCSDGVHLEPPAQQSQTSLAQRPMLGFIINQINGQPSWSNFCYVSASVLKELPCVQVTVLFAELRATGEASLHDKYSKRKANLS